jgi:NAD+--asparagine ADP-ribosyltransferase
MNIFGSSHILRAAKGLYDAKIEQHRINIKVLISSSTSIPEHTQIFDSIDKELSQLVENVDKSQALEKYFLNPQQ